MIDDAEGDTMEWDPHPVTPKPVRYVLSFASGRVFDVTHITRIRAQGQELVHHV